MSLLTDIYRSDTRLLFLLIIPTSLSINTSAKIRQPVPTNLSWTLSSLCLLPVLREMSLSLYPLTLRLVRRWWLSLLLRRV